METKDKRVEQKKIDPTKYDVISFNILNATVLEATDPNGLSDPYVRIGKVKSDSLFASRWLVETEVQEKTLSPTWNYMEEVIIGKDIDRIIIELWDKDTFRNDYIGRAYVDISELSDYKSFINQGFKIYKNEGDKKEAGTVWVIISKSATFSDSS
ncbi:hypothetical protein DLAC_07385 [Tieghemostelium lacteum]|uniref:C2 domain-containing protein n=1 Tax=Tieghemostelium lacteum TaxID=361077 RepID=A0A151ZCE0_TIELA|nr:hypothetical protein DLAC_07385 [Tieghemostelium lacteum]|eukprot:KYQ91616.1 hypothetical protein DLAC_07385 [Tieghemostelium lacteum]